MTYTPEQTERFFEKKIFTNLEGALREDQVEAAMIGITKGIAKFRVQYDNMSPELVHRMINVQWPTDEDFLYCERLVRFRQHPAQGLGQISVDAQQVVLKESVDGIVVIEISDNRVYPIAESMDEAERMLAHALARGTK